MNVFQNNVVLILLWSLFGMSATVAAAAADMTDEMKAQWKLWTYFKESIRWKSDWTRYHATNTSVKEHFQAYREFEAGDYEAGNYSTLQTNTYFYDDGSVSVPGCRACGPWLLDKGDPQTSSPYGVVHPSRNYMRTIMFPDRSAAWIMKDLPRVPECIGPNGPNTFGPVPCAGFELFLGDGGFLRLSIGLVYDDMGQLSQVSAIREDSRDFGLFWSYTNNDTTTTTDTTVAGDFLPLLTKYTDPNEKENALNNFWSTTNGSDDDGITTVSKVLVPGLEYIQQTDQGSITNRFNSLEDHEVFEIMPDGIVIVCPSHLPNEENNDDGTFQIVAGWKKDDDGSFVSSIEAMYENFTMNELVYTTFRKKKNSKSKKSKRGKLEKKHAKTNK